MNLKREWGGFFIFLRKKAKKSPHSYLQCLNQLTKHLDTEGVDLNLNLLRNIQFAHFYWANL